MDLAAYSGSRRSRPAGLSTAPIFLDLFQLPGGFQKGRRTKAFDRALVAERLSGHANLPPVHDHAMREIDPFTSWQKCHQVGLYLVGALLSG